MNDDLIIGYAQGRLDERDRILSIILKSDWSGESLQEDRDNLYDLITKPLVSVEES